MSKTRKLSKRKFCNLARKRSIGRKKFLKNIKKLSLKSHKARVHNLRRLCKNAKTKKTKKFCKFANSFSKKRARNDLRYVKKSLKNRNLRHKDLVKFCR